MTKPKSEMTRPKSETRKLTEFIGVRFSETHRLELEKAAASQGISVPALLRQSALQSIGVAS